MGVTHGWLMNARNERVMLHFRDTTHEGIVRCTNGRIVRRADDGIVGVTQAGGMPPACERVVSI